MIKRWNRIVALMLAFLLIFTTVAPCAVSTEAASVSEIEQQIRRVYQQAKDYYGRSSFHGYCGGLVNAELHFMGITSTVVGNNGNQEYDCYSKQTITSGGFRVNAYPPSRYTLEQALNAITENGTKDAYNILVGFEATRSVAGSRYGHAVVIHAILNGIVYYMESYDVNLNDKRYPEGSPISCSISDFAAYYKRTTVSLDGVIHFGTRSYADLCRVYPSYLTAVADAGAVVRTQPCEASVDVSSSRVRSLSAGEELTVTGLYLNTAGEYWYQIGSEGYVRAGQLQMKTLRFDDLSVISPTAPGVLRQGKGFNVTGTVASIHNSIYTVRARAMLLEDGGETQAMSATCLAESKDYRLKGSTISKELTFRRLAVGNYRYDLAAIVGNHYYQRGQVQIGWQTVELWSAEFQVVEGSTSYAILSFDPNGGTAATNQSVVAAGDTVGTLPTAQREGYVFLGWYAPDGHRVDDHCVPTEDMTLTAQWVAEQELYENWQEHGQCRYFYSDGSTTTGCVEIDGALYYFSSMEAMGQSWTTWTVAGAA